MNLKQLIYNIFSFFYILLYHTFFGIISTGSTIYRTKIVSNRKNPIFIKKSKIIKCRIIVTGKNNKILINGCFLDNVQLIIKGNDNQLLIKPNSVIINGHIWLEGSLNKIFIGKNYGSKKSYILNMGKENVLEIGDNCMLGEDVDIWSSDSHPIYDLNNLNQPINRSKSIIIGNHVWIGKHTRILKGVKIGNNAIIGMSSVVTKDIPANCIAVGVPAKITRQNITWSSNHINI